MSGHGSPDWLAPYDFELPEDRIARKPAEPRGTSRLLVLGRASGAREHTEFPKLGDFLEPGDLLVVNETRVLRARLRAELERTGRAVEIVLSHPDGEDWIALLGPSRRTREGDRLVLREGEGAFELVGRDEGPLFRLRATGDVLAMMEQSGHLPLPPYLGREDGPEDREWYQTVFARTPGAVAAPTAGLHFTRPQLDELAAGGITSAAVVLHVGPGTFLPVRAEREDAHRVLPERYEVSREAAEAMRRVRASGGRIIAVGTTVARTLETWASVSGGDASSGWTDLTVLPGHTFQGFDGLITNFHLPRSSLLLLVSAFAGRDNALAAYREAVEFGYRFYSYGDAMLIV
ncbi:MAG: tRNA preQ1(34) S-adenosylmethionine ribosyltransferase-isomerase QueA [Candidatus Eisenbacteria bacterium]